MTLKKDKVIVSQTFVRSNCMKCVWGKDTGNVIHCLRMPCVKIGHAVKGMKAL